MNKLVEILMQRDGMTYSEAVNSVVEAKIRIDEGEDPEEILRDDFGLEPDYIFDLL